MKKFLAAVLALMMLLSTVPAMGDVASVVAEGANLSHDELVEKAMAETGDFLVYGNTSRIQNAFDDFKALYNLSGEASNLKDGPIYTKLESEVNSSTKGADMVMIQDGAQLIGAMESGWLVNYVPASVAEFVAEGDQTPLVHQYINKLFIYNNGGDNVPAIKNVWELTAPEMKGNVIFKNPEEEQVNMNFLVMCTSPEWSEKLAEAYKAWKGEDIDLGDYENAGYKWVAEFLDNCSFGQSDTKIAEEVSQETAQGKIGLFVLSKLRSSSVLTENLTVEHYDATENGYAVEPFSGFMYPMYALMSAAATRPYTAMLFIEYLMTAEGFQPWGKSIGAYSTSSAVTPNEGDLGIGIWKDTLVMEDAEFILDNYEDVSTFVSKHLQ
ncbi:MAG: ABC transporter substrate-binding protein [Clostridia bacterium]|nr:ABC transporter substrate-binding protein [Clostridia bacterium]